MEIITAKNQISEKDFLEYFIGKLNSLAFSGEWILGDSEESMKDKKSADIVNHELGVVIEVKDDFSEKLIVPTESFEIVGNHKDLSLLSRRYKADIRDSNKKFRNYPVKYESITLIRYFAMSNNLEYLKSGLQRYTRTSRIPDTNVNITTEAESVSVFAFLNTRYGEITFWDNPYRSKAKTTEKIEEILKRIDESKLFKIINLN